MSEPVKIRTAGAADAAAWDAYVRAAPSATFFHRFGWSRVAKEAYGYDACYLMAERGGALCGVLPLIDVRSPLMGRNLISTAFTVGGGIAADDAQSVSALAEAALVEGRRRGVGYVELRGARAAVEDWLVKDAVYAGFERTFPVDEKENLSAIPRRRRAEVRKGLKALEDGSLKYEFAHDIDRFYSLYARAVRDLGTPIFPRRFADAVAHEFWDESEILTIACRREPVLVLLTFYGQGKTMPYYFGASPNARAFRAYDLAIWLQMRRGIDRGLRRFDFGRSKIGTGSFDFKSFWGFEAEPLEYQYALIGARDVPNVSPNNPKFARFSQMWKRLPMPVANLAGPFLARHLA